MENITRLENADILTLKVEAVNVTPKMHVVFMKQLPIMLPNARSKCPL
jgi:hypothetical protein